MNFKNAILHELASVFEWHKRFKEGRESVRDDERFERSKEFRTPELIGQIKNFIDKDRLVSIETISVQFDISVGTEDAEDLREVCPKCAHPCHRLFDQDGHQEVPHPPYSSDLALCDFWLFPKFKENFRGCRYETIEEMKEAVTKVIDTLTQEDFHGALQMLLEQCNKCIAAGGD